jgi:ribonuclease E
MQFPKLFVTLCATAIFNGVLCAQADDNAAQAAARAAVLQKMQELNGTTNISTPAPAPAIEVPPVQPMEVAPAVTPSAPVATVTPAPTAEAAPAAGDNAAQAAARAAVLQKMQEINGTANVNTPAAAPIIAAPIVAPTPAAPVTTVTAVTPAPTVEAAPAAGDNASQAAARAALIQKTVDLDPQRIGAAPIPSTPAALPTVMAPSSAVAPVVPVTAYHPIASPALPISNDQQSRLQALDAKYQANQISPLDYFTQREAILKGE